jgi:hypothetical protein
LTVLPQETENQPELGVNSGKKQWVLKIQAGQFLKK